ncbi:MAG: Mov34/MPN/PAD-1 family protein [Acidimicrobiales bacterium]
MTPGDNTDAVGLGSAQSGPTNSVLRIHMQRDAGDAMRAHASSDTSVEQGGVMVGEIDTTTSTLMISGAIPAKGAEATKSSLTFTHEAWDYINEQLSESWPDQRIVGWYHSHPGFGIFLSEFDQFICANFFNEPWQIAYVIDPISGDDGFFAPIDGELQRIVDWDVCTRTDAPHPDRPLHEPVRAADSGRPALIDAGSKPSISPIIGVLAGMILGAMAFAIFFRSGDSDDAVRRVSPQLTAQQTFVDAGSVALGRDGTLFVGEPGLLRAGPRSAAGLTAIVAMMGETGSNSVPPVTVSSAGRVFYVDPGDGSLAEVGGPTGVVALLDDVEVPWVDPTGIAIYDDLLWVLDANGAVYEYDVNAEESDAVPSLLMPAESLPLVAIAADDSGLYAIVDGEQTIRTWRDGAWAEAASDPALMGGLHLDVLDDVASVAVLAGNGEGKVVSVSLDDESAVPESGSVACPGPLAAYVNAVGERALVVVPTCTGVPQIISVFSSLPSTTVPSSTVPPSTWVLPEDDATTSTIAPVDSVGTEDG